MDIKHFSINQAALLALVAQAVAFAVGFGLLSSTEAQTIIPAATALVNSAFLVANSVHTLAHAHSS